MLFEKNVRIPTDDGAFVMANVFRPRTEARYPVLMSMSVYGKDIHTRDFNSDVWKEMVETIPDLCQRSSCEYHTWETPDPEVWVADGYVVIRVDSRGSGKSPGMLDPFSPREIRDLYNAIEWAASQPWSNGKVGLAGISYYAIIQWRVAALQPPNLAAIAPWEGANEPYREVARHGGILSNVFPQQWAKRQLLPIQHGNGNSHFHDMDDDGPVGGAPALSVEELERNRTDPLEQTLQRPVDGPYYRERAPASTRSRCPLSGANWGGFGCTRAATSTATSGPDAEGLEVHTGDHRAVLRRRGSVSAETVLRSLFEGRAQRVGEAASGPAFHPSGRRDDHSPRRIILATRPHTVATPLSQRRIERAPRATTDRECERHL
jgi:hypothetical protein